MSVLIGCAALDWSCSRIGRQDLQTGESKPFRLNTPSTVIPSSLLRFCLLSALCCRRSLAQPWSSWPRRSACHSRCLQTTPAHSRTSTLTPSQSSHSPFYSRTASSLSLPRRYRLAPEKPTTRAEPLSLSLSRPTAWDPISQGLYGREAASVRILLHGLDRCVAFGRRGATARRLQRLRERAEADTCHLCAASLLQRSTPICCPSHVRGYPLHSRTYAPADARSLFTTRSG